jgi:phosphoribosyl 1,2-cyclic phosphate phosphodiesterase
MRVTILGCGGSDGVPMVGGADGRGDWGVCDPANPRNRRTRAGLHVSAGDLSILVDTSPDLREQLLSAGIGRVTHVLYTHDHADHTHGINELRRLGAMNGGRMPIYGDAETLTRMRRRFGYAFEQHPGRPYPPILDPRLIDGEFDLGPLRITPFVQNHGFGQASLGFRFGNCAYSTDTIGFSEASLDILRGLDVWILDCFGERPHPTHAHWALALSWIEELKPRRAILTHMGAALDYETVRRRCPPSVEPAYDGLRIEL